ncbi:hypothetical protein L226DRAFT_567634 [Lentinus tigrinus ALCF2SS1-7]|uniref:Uncharacterized protein n=1 Tax=Lentinus tigrinus ALCF2SS1-6 TaxID=1328759 RepID=A0A5C2RZT9_9APHY|nr:hypothetical protein L227DRAFT_508279 [Lentinus tigrinus ALCF2SS1-6]RPD79542.1 hypothetical protein L226DRAFT_567634 [Lentinus tigrinus ALCF2SS1-7]
MFSFSSLAVFSTIAFSALASALPLSTPLGDLPVDPSAVTGVVSGLPVVGGIVGRADAQQSIAVILTGVTAQLGPATQALKFVTSQNATVDACSGPIGEIKDILTGAVVELQGLVGKPVEVILHSVEGTALITVEELGKLVAGLVVIVFEALGAVLKVAGATIDKALFDLLCVVGGLVGSLIALVLQLVGTVLGDLLAVVVPLIKTVVPFILHLNLAQVISLLKL